VNVTKGTLVEANRHDRFLQMKCGFLFWTVVLLSLCASAAWAQTPLNSFAALPQILKIGQEVIVRPERGGAVQGDIVSISDDEIVVKPRTGFNVTEHRFAKDMVRGIDFADPNWDGGLKGAAAGLAVMLAMTFDSGSYDPADSAEAVMVILGPLVVLPSTFVGYAIDSMWHKNIYERPSQFSSRVTVAPMIRRDELGAMARIRF
jgi:hypothetical protein